MKKRIAIVGAGPAGSMTALSLLRHGVDPGELVIFDRAIFPRPKLCGGAITFRGTEILSEWGFRPDGGCETRGLSMTSRFGALQLREPGPQWLFERSVLDAFLLGKCRREGVDIREGARVESIEPATGGWRVCTATSKESVDWVIGADGAAGITRRASGLTGGFTGRLIEGVFASESATLSRDWLHFSFDPIFDGISGYAWIFPYPAPGKTGLWKIGIMAGRDEVPGAVLRKWTLNYARVNGFRLAEERLAGWPEKFYSRHSAAHRPGLILVGEAHGIDGLLGEGIAPALSMAAFAAKRLKESLDGGRSSIRGYERRFLFSEEGWNLYFHEFLAHRLYGKNGLHWLRALFERDGVRRLGESGDAAYGRLARHAGPLLGVLMERNRKIGTAVSGPDPTLL